MHRQIKSPFPRQMQRKGGGVAVK